MNGSAPFLSTSSDMAMGVAALDPPLVQQTKSEIRTLASEIAKLAHAELTPAEFYSGFLPRLCLAMGAEAAAVWQTEASLQAIYGVTPTSLNSSDAAPMAEFELRLIAHHSLPHLLFEHDPITATERPTKVHGRILQCVMAEGQPILVPPKTMRIESQRPNNPIDDSLIIVPVRVQNDIEFLLQVVQPSSGGPAAQRGYLRFVAQMADLMSDYLRRQALRDHAKRVQELQDFEYWLSTIAQALTPKQKIQSAADALADLLGSQQVLLLRSGARPKVLAVSNLTSFDPRSETVLAAQILESKLKSRTELGTSPVTITAQNSGPNLQPLIENFCSLATCKRVVRAPLAENSTMVAWLAFSDLHENAGLENADLENAGLQNTGQIDKLTRIKASIAGLLIPNVGTTLPMLAWLFGQPNLNSKRQLTRSPSHRWTMRVVLVALLTIIAIFPVPQQFSMTAVLAPIHKKVYYAPSLRNAVVQDVFVKQGQFVSHGERLLQLSNTELENETTRLTGEHKRLEKVVQYLNEELLRTDPASQQGRQLQNNLREHELKLMDVQSDLSLLQKQEFELNVVAKQAGQIASWDISNNLAGRPVNPGDKLLETFQPDGAWQLQISIPEQRIGLIADALEVAGENGLRVHYWLSSYPNQPLEGKLTKLAQQTTQRAPGQNVVFAAAIVDSNALPMKKDGAIAHATVDCGRVPAAWLIVRDVYWACSSRIKMLW